MHRIGRAEVFYELLHTLPPGQILPGGSRRGIPLGG